MRNVAEPTQTAIEKLIARMSIEQLVGQLLITGFSGFEVCRDLSGMIDDHLIGGVMLFRRNLFDEDQAAHLCEKLQDAAGNAGEQLPMLVMIDQEGGRVTRFDFMTMLPSAMALGAADSPTYAYMAGEIAGKELCALGINVNLAPVLDLAVNPQNTCIGTRAFGAAPELVSRLGVQYINGLQGVGVMAAAKHFPGLGRASFDTHKGSVSIDKTLDELLECDLVPFAEAIKAGVAMVMATHCQYPRLDGAESVPASLSPYIITDLLRQGMGFAGPVVSDDLLMAAITERFSLQEAAIRAVSAGTDILLLCHNGDAIREVHAAILNAMKQGTLRADRVVDAATKVLWLKAEIGTRLAQRADKPSLSGLDLEMHDLLAHEIAQNSICLVRDDNGLLPIAAEERLLVIHPRLDDLFNLPPPRSCASIHEAMLDYFGHVAEVHFSLPGPSSDELGELRDKAAEADLLILCTLSAAYRPGQLQLGETVSSLGKPCILIALDEPYDVNILPGFGTAIASFGFGEPTVRALASVLAGQTQAEGTMPVRV